MSVHDLQQRRLSDTISWARKIREHLQGVLDEHQGLVHFRPSSGGIAMVGLTPERPQRGKSAIKNLAKLAANFAAEFRKHCVDIEQEGLKAEKILQSWMIAEAYRNHRRMVSLNMASAATPSPVELLFVTDEIAMPTTSDGKGRIVCDMLALRALVDGIVPVVVELKTERRLKRLVAQVRDYAALVDEHAGLFAELYSATLGKDLIFTGPCERWIVWPMSGEDRDAREEEPATAGVRVVGYSPSSTGFDFRVGENPLRR